MDWMLLYMPSKITMILLLMDIMLVQCILLIVERAMFRLTLR